MDGTLRRMQIAIVGLAGAGKTTVFNTLTRGHAETGGYGGIQLNVGVVKVPDDRLERLAEVFKPKKIVQADVTYIDLPAPPASSEGRVGTEELPPEHLARLREADALIHVVRAWDDAAHPHPDGSVDPARDLERLDLEFILSDLALVDRRLERLAAGGGRHGTPAEREAAEREDIVLRRLKVGLEAGRPLRDEPLEPDEEKAIRGFRFLTQKPVLVLLNVGEDDIAGSQALVDRITASYPHHKALVDALSARIEMELGELEPDEAAVFMEELGLTESSLDRVIKLSYRLVGLISFLTAGPDEVRAWPVPDGSSAVDAAGAIHTDLARGFIRAETIAYEELLAAGSMAEAKRHGKVRSEGKTYRVQDGDVVEILFSR
jgi:ribosome-binding ATPase